MNDKSKMDVVNEALAETELLMSFITDNGGDEAALMRLSDMYAQLYSAKLRLMAMENKHARS